MDIFTHAAIGLIAAGPFLAEQPALALGLVAGSVLPDLDALARLPNKRSFLRVHQTWTHALPIQVLFSAGVGSIATILGYQGVSLGAGLLAGLAGHSLLDLINTFGVALFKPFASRRFCLEWVFFIDVVITLPDYRSMRDISPAYHVVRAAPVDGGTYVLCRDMRTRNFGTRFGDLEVWLDTNRQIIRSRFHV